MSCRGERKAAVGQPERQLECGVDSQGVTWMKVFEMEVGWGGMEAWMDYAGVSTLFVKGQIVSISTLEAVGSPL